MKNKKNIRIGVLGCSDIAQRRFLPAIAKAGNAELAAVASRDPEKASRFCPSGRCAATGYDDLLQNSGVDLVYISLPNHLHEEWSIKALEHGKHVICEKPLGLSFESVERMVRRAEQRGLLLYENIMYLHHPLHCQVRDMIEADRIGNVKSLRAVFGFHLEAAEGFRLRTEQGGGSFHDLARYPLSTALYFLNGATYRFSGYFSMREDLNVGMNACGVTSDNESFWFSTGFEQQYECWYELVGDRGKLRVERAYTTPADLVNTIEVITGRETTSVTVPAADHFALMLEHVCGLILLGGDYRDAYYEARRLALLAEQLRLSCHQVGIKG